KEEIAARLIEASPWKGMDVEVQSVEVAGYDAAGMKFDRVEVLLPRGMKNTGRVTASVSFFFFFFEIRRLWASARIQVYRKAAVALNPLKMNKVIERDDVKFVRTELSDTASAAVEEEDVVGMTVLRPIPAGAVIRKEYLRTETLIRRGETVTIVVDNGRLRVKSKGKAAEDGYKDGVVRARTASGKEVKGKVTGRGEMTVNF
ncbi:MAG: flagellar basal body P-ring formation protein FlgA, partial [Deltaproteobacteria bacterium]|nr:flagellar basal body P-ring formation protein FlgA [Deltaproteobacteria bacterium]